MAVRRCSALRSREGKAAKGAASENQMLSFSEGIEADVSASLPLRRAKGDCRASQRGCVLPLVPSLPLLLSLLSLPLPPFLCTREMFMPQRSIPFLTILRHGWMVTHIDDSH